MELAISKPGCNLKVLSNLCCIDNIKTYLHYIHTYSALTYKENQNLYLQIKILLHNRILQKRKFHKVILIKYSGSETSFLDANRQSPRASSAGDSVLSETEAHQSGQYIKIKITYLNKFFFISF